jgi:hypothetical protein
MCGPRGRTGVGLMADEIYCEGCLWRLRPTDVVSLLRAETPGPDDHGSDAFLLARGPDAFAHVGHEPPGYSSTRRGVYASVATALEGGEYGRWTD